MSDFEQDLKKWHEKPPNEKGTTRWINPHIIIAIIIGIFLSAGAIYIFGKIMDFATSEYDKNVEDMNTADEIPEEYR